MFIFHTFSKPSLGLSLSPPLPPNPLSHSHSHPHLLQTLSRTLTLTPTSSKPSPPSSTPLSPPKSSSSTYLTSISTYSNDSLILAATTSLPPRAVSSGRSTSTSMPRSIVKVACPSSSMAQFALSAPTYPSR